MKIRSAEKRGILLVAFGTCDPAAKAALDRVGEAAARRFPDAGIRWAYTSAGIRRRLACQGDGAASPEDALAGMRKDGFARVAVQPLQIAAGSEYHDLARLVAAFRRGPDPFRQIELGEPLLARRRDVEKVVESVLASLPERKPEDAVVLMGHGNRHGNGDMAYLATAALFQKADKLAFLGTLEGQPGLDDVLAQCRAVRPAKAFLVPFMTLAGGHARNDLAGPAAHSWKSRIEQLGIECVPVFLGMGQIAGAVEVWLDHLGGVWEKLEAKSPAGGRSAGLPGQPAKAESPEPPMPDDHAGKPPRGRGDDAVAKPIFPVGLLAAGRRCLVVGGGGVGSRKAGLLLDAGAEVTVVSPGATGEVEAWAEAGRLRHVDRVYEPGDVEGCFLVFAATSDRQVNRKILAHCRKAGIIASSIDDSWPDGDFVTPATVRKGGVVLSISTGGKSCRQAKWIRNSMARHLGMAQSAGLVVIGACRDGSPAERLPPLLTAERRVAETGELLTQLSGMHEFVIVATGDRMELHAVAGNAPELENALAKLLGLDGLAKDEIHVKRGIEAFRHTARLAAGLLSTSPGESSTIVSRLEAMQALAQEKGWAGAIMAQWHAAALQIGGEIRRAAAGGASTGGGDDAAGIGEISETIIASHEDIYDRLVSSFQSGGGKHCAADDGR